MEEKIKNFFEETAKEATDYLCYGADILLSLGKSSYVVKVSDEGAVEVARDDNGTGDLEIMTDEEILDDLYSSASLAEYREKMVALTIDFQRPTIKIHMERTEKNGRKFFRRYANWLRRVYILH